MVDTGAQISVIPPLFTDRRHRQDYDLQAANSSTITTHGRRSLTLNLGLRRISPRSFTIADVHHAIIGADFLRHFNLLDDLRSCSLRTHLQVNVIATSITSFNLVHPPLPSSPFILILQEFPEITRPSNRETPVKHQVVHHIVTQGPPCSARPRRLTPDRLKIGKTEFQHMLDLIIRPASFVLPAVPMPLLFTWFQSHNLVTGVPAVTTVHLTA